MLKKEVRGLHQEVEEIRKEKGRLSMKVEGEY